MAEFEQQRRFGVSGTDVRSRAEIDEGLRSYMLRVYNYMASGVLLTGIMAWLGYSFAPIRDMLYEVTPLGQVTGYSMLGMIVAFSPLALVLLLSFGGFSRMSAKANQAVFWAFATLMGLSLSSIFFMYTGGSIARVFFITAAAFGSLSLYGYTTKKDLSGWGTFLFMGLIGIIIAMVVNWFLASPALYYAISLLGVLIFAGLTAYDTQKIKEAYFEGDSHETASKKAIMGALMLYLDFINMFIMLLRLFGNRN